MDTSRSPRWFGRLIFVLSLAAFFPGLALAQTMPSVTPISIEPTGPATGGGVTTRVTYEMRLAANDATAATAANEASYVTRAVTISGPTMGGILAGAVRLGARAIPWVAAALTAYEAYKWYTGQDGVLMQPGQNHPGFDCGGGPYWVHPSAGSACSLPGIQYLYEQYEDAYYGRIGYTVDSVSCVQSTSNAAYCSGNVHQNSTGNPGVISPSSVSYFDGGAPQGTSDPTFVSDPSPVTDVQLQNLVQDHPEWWPEMLKDPQTGQPLLTPEIADDIDAYKKQIAPRYGVDPQTLPQTQPDPDYQNGVAQPRETQLPAYCGWATDACDYYKWVEDHWPDKDPKTYLDTNCDTPPSCTGDDVLCGVARNTWSEKCALSGDGSKPPKFGTHVVTDIEGPDQQVGDPSQLDTTGFGYGTQCPFLSQDIPFGDSVWHMDVGPICDYGPWLRYFLLALAALKCAQIMAGLRDSGM